MKRKTVFLLCLILLTVIGLSGCRRHGATIDRIMEHLAQKYPDDTFIFDYDNTALLLSGVRIVAHSERFPDKEIEAVCYNYGETEDYYDTYLGIKYEDQTREYFTQLFANAFHTNCSVTLSPYYHPLSHGDDMPFDEYLASYCCEFSARVDYCPKDGKETLEKVTELLAGLKLDCSIYFADDLNDVMDTNSICPNYRPGMHICISTYGSESDNFAKWFVGGAYLEETKNYISQRIEKGFGTNSLVVSVYHQQVGFDSIPTFEEYISVDQKDFRFVAVVNYKPEDKEETLETVKTLFADIDVSGTIYFVDDPSLILDESTAKQIMEEKKYFSELYFFKSSPETYNKIEWKE